MHAVGQSGVDGVRSVHDGAWVTAARREEHVRRFSDPDHDSAPAFHAYA